MAINTIKPFPVLPVIPVRERQNADEKQRQKKDQNEDDKNSQKRRHRSKSGDGHIDEFA